MKTIFFLLSISSFMVAQTIELPFYKKTNLFTIFCVSADRVLIDDMVKEGEPFFKQLEDDFKYHYEGEKIILQVYPDRTSFSEVLDHKDAPAWVIAKFKLDHEKSEHEKVQTQDKIMIVSPNNPGPCHTFGSARGILKRILISFVINKKYDLASIPRWLWQGTVLHKIHYYSPSQHNNLMKKISVLPTIEQLEAIDQGDCNAFDKLHGVEVSFSLVEFIATKWGWNRILELLESYSDFEYILNISKSDFHNQWLDFLKNKFRALIN